MCIRDSSEVIRFFMLSAHYRNPINFADTLMEQAKSAVEMCIRDRYLIVYIFVVYNEFQIAYRSEPVVI